MVIMLYTENLFLLPEDLNQAAVVTTNGIIKTNGALVMGAGIAKYCRDAYPGIDKMLGTYVSANGNVPAYAGIYQDANRLKAGLDPRVKVLSCPTKHHWKDYSDISLICKSCNRLVELANRLNLEKIYFPALGCSLGHLNWLRDVRPAIEPLLDDRFVAAIHPDHLW